MHIIIHIQDYPEFHQMGISQLTNSDHIDSPVLDRLVVTKNNPGADHIYFIITDKKIYTWIQPGVRMDGCGVGLM